MSAADADRALSYVSVRVEVVQKEGTKQLPQSIVQFCVLPVAKHTAQKCRTRVHMQSLATAYTDHLHAPINTAKFH